MYVQTSAVLTELEKTNLKDLPETYYYYNMLKK